MNIFPVLEISQCFANQENYFTYINKSMTQFMLFQLFHNLLFFTMVFVLRDVADKFNIGGELRRVCVISVLCMNFYVFAILFLDQTLFVILGYC